MKNDKEIEQILLNDEKYEKFIKTKTEQEFNQVLENAAKKHDEIITDIKNVPSGKLFSKNATYLVINKDSKTKSFINGLQAESYLVSSTDRQKFLDLKTDSFVYQECYIKFFQYKG